MACLQDGQTCCAPVSIDCRKADRFQDFQDEKSINSSATCREFGGIFLAAGRASTMITLGAFFWHVARLRSCSPGMSPASCISSHSSRPNCTNTLKQIAPRGTAVLLRISSVLPRPEGMFRSTALRNGHH